MSKLLPVILFGLLMSFLSDKKSSYELDECGCKQYLHKEFIFYFIMSVSMAIFVGLRTRGNDTYTYRQTYEIISGNFLDIYSIEWSKLSQAPGLQAFQIIIKSIGASTQDYFMLTGFFVTYIYLWFVKKYTSNIRLSVFYFITMGVYTFSMAAIKQSMVVAFLMLATDNAIQRKWIKFALWLVIAEFFHPYAFIYIVVPFLTFGPWSRKSYYLIGGTLAVSLLLSRLMGVIEDVTDTLGYSYDSGSFTSDGVNIFRVLVVWITVVISFLGRDDLRNSTDQETNIIINLSMMNAIIMFMGLFGTANYFARLVYCIIEN